jgi:hypothetical protein
MVTVIIAGCAHQITEYPTQPLLTRPAIFSHAVITVEWVRTVDEVKARCTGILPYACAKDRYNVGSTAFCTIVAIEPRDFNDLALLAILGHESWHCFGAEHVTSRP